MSLQGTFDVFSMPELLRMLASAGKSGTLIVESAGVGGRLELSNGQCSDAESAELRGALQSSDELHQRAVEVCFAMTRHPGGAFRFVAIEGVAAPSSPTQDRAHGFAIPIEPVLGELELLVAEWVDICRVIPSTDLRPAIATQLAVDEIVIQAREWKLLAQFDGMTSIDDLCATNRSLVETCRAVAELVRRGAATLEQAPALGSSFEPEVTDAGGDVSYFGPRVVPVAPYGPGVDNATDVAADGEVSPASEPSSHVELVEPDEAAIVAESGEPGELGDSTHDPKHDAPLETSPQTSDPRDRGAILRMFSGLREA